MSDKYNTYIKIVDDYGRVAIPKKVRQAIGVDIYDKVEVYVSNDEYDEDIVIIRKAEE